MEFESLFTSAIEVGIGITGFSGIVAVLGQRSAAEWTRGDRGRMWILLQNSFATVLLSFLPLLVSGMVASGEALWTICSGMYVAYTAPLMVIRIPRIRELRKEPENKVGGIYFNLVVSGMVISVLLQLANIIWLRTGWPYAFAVLWTMTFSFTMFVRLMRLLWTSKAN